MALPRTGIREAGSATLRRLTERERGLWLNELGKPVCEHAGRYWFSPRPGFWRPVHILARLTIEQATRPARACWGYTASLCATDAGAANVGMPVHWLEHLDDHSEDALSSNRRYQLRKARRLVDYVEVTDPDALLDEGYEVMRSSLGRTRFEEPIDRPAFERKIELELQHGGIVLAGLVDGKIAGFVNGFAVGDTAYLDDLYLATEALSTQISIGLQFEFVAACRRTQGIRQLIHGVHALEDEQLTMYKERIGFPVRKVPARLWLAPGARALLRRAAPTVHYRWTGDASGRADAASRGRKTIGTSRIKSTSA